jgi:hypothetical protein
MSLQGQSRRFEHEVTLSARPRGADLFAADLLVLASSFFATIPSRSRRHFTPKTCWIAHVLSDHGLTRRTAPNRINPGVRQEPCPAEKRGAIIDALRELKMLG